MNGRQARGVTFVRSEGPTDRLVVVRADGSAATVAVHRYLPGPPHDLVHYAVEFALALRWGFFGLVHAGARLDSVLRAGARSPRTIAAGEDPLVAAHRESLLLAEMLVNGLGELDVAGSAVSQRLAEMGADPRYTDPEVVSAIRFDLTRLGQVWAATPVGGRLRLPWPPEYPS